MKPCVSVIIPVYNLKSVIGRCIESILQQTYTDFEVLIVDDGSTDNTLAVCKTYMNDARVACYTKENGGASDARNYGLSRAKGQWVMFVDGDDYVEPDFFSKLLMNMDAELIISGVRFYNINSYQMPCGGTIEISEFNGHLLDKEFCKFYFRTPWAKLFRRDVIAKYGLCFDTTLHIGEDAEFVFRYLGFVKKVRLVPICGYCYKVDFFEQASKHAMNSVGISRHLDAILYTKGLRQLKERINYGFPLTNNLLQIYFRRLFFIYLTKEIDTYNEFLREIRSFNKLGLKYYSSSILKEVIVTFVFRNIPLLAYAFLYKHRKAAK